MPKDSDIILSVEHETASLVFNCTMFGAAKNS